MQLSLLKEHVIYTSVLPNKKKGQYWVTQVNDRGSVEKVVSIEGIEDRWILKSNRSNIVLDAKGNRMKEQPLEPMRIYNIYLKKTDEYAVLFSEPITEDRKRYTKVLLPDSGTITIGRTSDCHIYYSNQYISSKHAELVITENKLLIRDCNSSNGTFVNGRRIHEKVLKPGDVLYIIGLKIIIGDGFISLNNPDGTVTWDHTVLSAYIKSKPVTLEEDEDEDESIVARDLFYRSPRFKRDIEKKVIKIDPPPAMGDLEQTPLMLMLGPSITMGMASLSMGVFTLYNVLQSNGNLMTAMPTLTMSFSMLLGTILWPILTRKYEAKKRLNHERQRKEKYKIYIGEIRKQIEKESEYQHQILHENLVTIEDCAARIREKRSDLWERTHRQNDFLRLRLGIGSLPLEIQIQYPEKRFSMDEDELQDELYQLAEEPKLLHDVPVSISLIEEWVSGLIGDREQVVKLARGLVIQLTALHSYDELKLVFIYDKSEEHLWNFSRWLPHVWSTDGNIRFIASSLHEVKDISSYLEKEVAARKAITNEEELKERTPYYVVFAADKKLATKAEALNTIMKDKKYLGFSIINLYDQLNQLPKECSMVIEYDEEQSRIYDKDDISGQFIAFQPDVVPQEQDRQLAVRLANIQLDTASDAYVLPNTLTFLDMFQVGKIEHLNALTRWKENDPTRSLGTPIGVTGDGEYFYLDLHEKFHGSHGLIAGMTGSGKSEFIMTYILSLAVNYHPNEVAFVLIDYKGGGMANAFSELPHLAGTITNLDGAAVNRSLVSIQSELRRRQTIFSEAGKRLNMSNIDIYAYQRLYREGQVEEPLQHLFIISDEFAELKTQQPEFMEQLISAARIGRSLGVHLILATQKPSGVVDDQIWSNSKFRICLKVQERADSMDVIKRPDAAELSVTGRFYVQVGFNELFELGQSAWAGAPYYPTDRIEKNTEIYVSVIDPLGRVIRQAKLDKRLHRTANPLKQIDGVNRYLSRIAREEGVSVRPLWLEPIPALIYTDELGQKYSDHQTKRYDFNPIIGEVDDPANQRQFALTFPLTREGNAIIYGSSGSGDTTFLTTLIYALIHHHTPEELQMYLLDFGSETLRAFERAPHVGDVLLSHDAERIQGLIKYLQQTIAERKKKLSEYGGDYTSYIQATEDSLASIVVIIHNFSAFTEIYGDLEESISYLTREGLKVGIYFVLTAQSTNAVRYRILQNFKQLYALQLNDISEYSGIFGNVDGVYPSKIYGRGIYKTDRTYEFQVARIHRKIEQEYEFIRNYVQEYVKNWKGAVAVKIPVLPDKVDISFLQDSVKGQPVDKLPIGVDTSSLQVSPYAYDQAYVQLVLSRAIDVPEVIQGFAESIAAFADTKLTVIDPLQLFIENASKQYVYIADEKQLEQAVTALFQMLVERNNAYKDAQEAGEELPEFNKETYLIVSMSELLSKLSDDGKDKLRVLLDKGELHYNVNILIYDSTSGVTSYSYDSWFRNKLNLSDGLWIGAGITDQYHYKLNKITSDLYQEISSPFGYVIRKGKAALVKFVTSIMHNGDESDG